MIITSRQNKRIIDLKKLSYKKYRDEQGKFLIEEEHLVEEAYKKNLIETLIRLEDYNPKIKVDDEIIVTKEVMKCLSTNVSLPKVMALCHKPIIIQDVEDKIVILDGVQDPGNVGTIIRTALSFGFTTIYLSKDCADVYSPKVLRSTQGSLFNVNIVYTSISEIIKNLKANNYEVYVTALKDAENIEDVNCYKKLALVFGNEGNGVRDSIISLADRVIKIPMDSFESLNVAVAAGICMYKFRRM